MRAPSAYPSSKRTANERYLSDCLSVNYYLVFFSIILTLIMYYYTLMYINEMTIDDTKLALYQWPSIKASDVTKYLQIPARRVLNYVDSEMVRISEKRPGTGNSRMLTPTNVMEMILIDRLEGIGITPKRMARFSERLSEAIHGFLKNKGATKYRYVHVTSKTGGDVLVHWPAKSAKSDDWATLVIDLVQLQKDFEQLFKKYWLTPVDLGDSARYIDL